ncbi:hypothetical protein G6F42_023179 [Rhizopus arrhizus]|nr:hypothetical protein G6F42_023179 [Rhizopus arrhizus]
MNSLVRKAQLVSSLSQISPDAAVREASVAAETKYDQFSIEQSMRHDMYSVITSYIAKTDLDSLDAEDARLLRKMERSFRRNGLHLSEKKRNEFKELRKRLSEVCIEFNKNWARESSNGLKTEEEDGVTKYILTMKYPDVRPVLKLCKNENTRKVHATAYESRNKENIPLLEEAVKLRRQAAKILGYKSHADYVLEVKMAKTVEAVDKVSLSLIKWNVCINIIRLLVFEGFG